MITAHMHRTDIYTTSSKTLSVSQLRSEETGVKSVGLLNRCKQTGDKLQRSTVLSASITWR